MPPETLVLDGLWYCLCPSYSPASLYRARCLLQSVKRASRLASTPPRRCYRSSNNHSIVGVDKNFWHKGGWDGESLYENHSVVQSHWNANTQLAADIVQQTIRRAPKKAMGVPRDLERRSTENLENMLQDLMVKSPSILSATQILRCLIRDRHVRPEVRHYRALILANTDAERGSPKVVRKLLSEMEENRIPTDSGTLHAALQVLAVHPDYVLRQQILDTLRDRWLPLSPAGWHFVIAGLVRERQLELALDHVAAMETKGIPIESWLHSLLVYNLCDVDEFEEVLNLMCSRDRHNHITKKLWMYVLDAASTALHHETTSYVWNQQVGLGYLHPPYRVCSNVLTVASRTGDTDLAASVFHYFTETGTPPDLRDYERLAEAHVMSGDLYTAFYVLCNTQKAGIPLEERSTRSVLKYMIQNETDPLDAWAMLKRLKALRCEIPIHCAKVLIDLCEHNALHDPSAMDDGIALYEELYTLCPNGADVSTYNTLIRMCRRGRSHQAVMFVIKEMASLGVVPDSTTFEYIILVCLDVKDYRSAYMYFQDMLERGCFLSEDGRMEIRDLSAGSDDVYAVQLRSHPLIEEEPVPDRSFNDEDEDEDEVESGQEEGGQSRPARGAGRRERQKRRRKRLANKRAMEEEGWMNWEAGGLIPDEPRGDSEDSEGARAGKEAAQHTAV
ncbi:hypothetical protein MAP00_004465 [Monascus purpureus]|nr:hypothetical protein MAP00_004465 [Monascus purpureus]